MNNLTHTKGPWYYKDTGENTITILRKWDSEFTPSDNDGYGSYLGIHIAELKHQNDNPCVSKKTAEANACLMSCAPEMLKELLLFKSEICIRCDCNPCKKNDECGYIMRIIKLIEKATGLTIEEAME